MPPVTHPSVGFLVGPGVLAHVDGVRALAERLGVAAINTWGAKGVFRWDSPYHGGTAGLQARDFELAGLGEVDVLVTSGLDPAEVTSRPWEGRAEVVDVAPAGLAAFGEAWPHPPTTPSRPRLYTDLAAVVGPLYEDPATPAARARALSLGLAPAGVVVAPPGLVGFWVARTWPTVEPGSVIVPATTEPRRAERAAREAAAEGRPVLLVTDSSEDIPGVEVVVWDGDLAIPQALLDLAGPLVAWQS
jgi:Thiamine pyrophosphate enzyme, central domain